MMKLLVVAALAVGAAEAGRSAGCGTPSTIATGTTQDMTFEFGGDQRTYTIFIPESYDPDVPLPVVVSSHGWGGTSLEDACDSGLTAVAKNTSEFIVVHPQGRFDYGSGRNTAWASWHFNGSCANHGVSCDTSQTPDQYCYKSNTDCSDCDWTTCSDDVAFIDALLDEFETTLCIDTAREYATGQSNGGMFTYQLGASLSGRLAAIAPISGSLSWGNVVAPETPVPVLAVTGTRDGTVPGNGTAAGKTSDGTWWYYSMDQLAEEWSAGQQCDGVESVYPTMWDGYDDLWCKTKCGNVDHVLCSWSGNHNYYSGPGMQYIFSCTPENMDETYWRNGQLVWEFFSKHSRA